MFGVALDMQVGDFKRVIQAPKASVVGLLSQFVLLPALTFLIVILVEPSPSISLGMMMVAACPGGNISNFMTYHARGNTALSVSLTSIGTVLAIFTTPLNLEFWAGLYPPTAAILKEVSLDPIEVFKTILILIGIPLLLGMVIRRRFPKLAQAVSQKVKPVSILIFVAFVGVAFFNNFQIFIDNIQWVVSIVFLHNAVALATGYFAARIAKLDIQDQRTIAIETGIQNSGLGLILIFGFFNGLGGMAIVAAWWGIWHIISGLTIASFWSYRKIAPSTV